MTAKSVPLTEIDEADFWSKVDVRSPEDCWEWQTRSSRNGYGAMGVNGRVYYAHRIAFALTYGEIPVGKLLRHSCDNRRCCNPAHLLPGTDWDNAQDAVERGRYRHGEQVPWAKLTAAKASRIRQLYTNGVKVHELSKIFDVSKPVVRGVLSGRTYTKDLFGSEALQTCAEDITDALEALRQVQTIVSGHLGPQELEPTKQNIVLYFLALLDEVTELLHELNWKKWANTKTIDPKKVASEFADILAFLGVITLYLDKLGISPSMLGQAYTAKSQVNINRFNGKVAGYEQTDWTINGK